MKVAGNIRTFKSPKEAAIFLRRSSFKPNYSPHSGELLDWRRVDSETHHLISATTEVLPSGRVRVVRTVVSHMEKIQAAGN